MSAARQPAVCEPTDLDPLASSPAKKTLMIVPTYNEAVNIEILLGQLLEFTNSMDVLVVDDGSPDGTGGLVEKHPEYNRRVFLLKRPPKSGYAGACREGYQWGLQRDYAACGTMDADRSHDPADVPRLIEAIQQGTDLAVGSRYLNGIRIMNWPLSRLLLSSFAGYYIRFLTGIPMTDPTSGFKMIGRSLLESADLSRYKTEGYGFIVELNFFAYSRGFKIVEVPIVFTERQMGDSKMSKRIIFESAFTVLSLLGSRLLGRSPGKPEVVI